jgi:hypothetical protein
LLAFSAICFLESVTRPATVWDWAIIKRIDFARRTTALIAAVVRGDIGIAQFGDVYVTPEAR